MKNPFVLTDGKGRNYVNGSCSLNKMIIAEVPVRGIDDTVEGKSVKEFFSACVIMEKAKEHLAILQISKDTPPRKIVPLLMQSAESESREVRLCAEEIARFFGRRLALILLTLKTGLDKNKAVRCEWSNEHWEYWKNRKTVILTGGLTEGVFGKILVGEAQKYCENSYHLFVAEQSVYSGVSGCTTLLEQDNGIFVLADFGQTNMKRSIVERRNGKVVRMENLPSVPSLYMEWNIADIQEKKRQATLLHRYITDTLCETYHQAETLGDVDTQIVIAVASYTHDGILNNVRGGYAKLNVLSENYSDYLSQTLSDRLQKNIHVVLIHDGTAVALQFSSVPDSVCLTLGTFVGVGFTDILVP